MSIVAALILNVVIIALIAVAVGLLAGKTERDGAVGAFGGLATFWFLTVLSFWGWVIYVVLHFVAKVW